MPFRIFALPGMGADARLFPAPWQTLPHFHALDWTPAFSCRTIRDVATTLCETHAIADGDILVGTSLGGIVACEIARLRKLRHLILIGSAVSRQEINGLIIKLAPWADNVPVEWMRLSAQQIPTELTQMFGESDAKFIKAMCKDIASWPGAADTSPAPYRIHGRHDHLINRPGHVDHWLEGGHLIALTHAKECVDQIRQMIGA